MSIRIAFERCAGVAVIGAFGLLGAVSIGSAVGAPTDATATLTADTYTRSDSPDVNYGAGVRWSTQYTSHQARNAFLMFDVPDVPADKVITGARLEAFSSGASTGGVGVDFYTTDASWTESGLTWNSQPGRQTWCSGQTDYADSTWVTFDLKRCFPTAMVDGGRIAFRAQTTDPLFRGFHSKEHPSGNKPRLVVTTDDAPAATVDPSGETMPLGDLSDFKQVFTDDFDTDVPVGQFPTAVSAKWFAYPGTWKDTSGNGTYDCTTQCSVAGGLLTLKLQSDGTAAKVAAPVPKLPGSTTTANGVPTGQSYGRYAVRFRADPVAGFKTAWLLWPDSEQWPADGEIDFPEGSLDSTISAYMHRQHATSGADQDAFTTTATYLQWHTAVTEWVPGRVTFLLDGQVVGTSTRSVPSGPMHWVLQTETNVDSTAPPAGDGNVQIDWVSVWDYTGTDDRGVTRPPPSHDTVSIAAVGDMNPTSNTSALSASAKNARAIRAALESGQVQAFVGLGDFQYDVASCNEYVNYWSRLWAGIKPRTYWVSAPNHDWQPGRNEDLDDFMNGQCSGDTSKSAINAQRGFIANGDPYSFDLGNWHFAMLSTALWRYDTTKANQVTTWLDNDLATAKAAGKHLAVVYHDPYFTSSTSSHSRESAIKPWVEVMWKHRVRLTLSGSQHNYERSCPINDADECVQDGMTAFQVSTGGIGLRSFTSSPSYIVHRFSDTHGWLQLDLRSDGSFSWNFNGVAGPSTDSGTHG